MIHTINRTVTTIEPIEVELNLPAYFKVESSVFAFNEDLKIVEVYNSSNYSNLSIYAPDTILYQNKKDAVLCYESCSEDEFFQALEMLVNTLKPNK